MCQAVCCCVHIILTWSAPAGRCRETKMPHASDTRLIHACCLQDPKGEFSLELTLSNLHPTHTAFWVHLTLLRATKGPDEPHALRGASHPAGQPGWPVHSSAACTQGTAGQSVQTCEPLHVGHMLDRKLRWVRVLPVFWSDNYLTIPPLDSGSTQVQPV